MLLPHWECVIVVFLCNFTHFHTFSHFLLIFTTSTLFWVDFSSPWRPQEGRGDVAILMNRQSKMDTWGNKVNISPPD